MKTAVAALLLFASLLFAAQQQRKRLPPEVEILHLTAYRSEGRIDLDGRVKVAGETDLQGLVLLVHLMTSDDKVILSGHGEVSEELLEVGQEHSFHFKVLDQARAVRLRIDARDGRNRHVAVSEPGPYPIE